MLLNEKIKTGLIKEIGNNELVAEVEGKLLTISLSDSEANEIQQLVLENDNLLLPVNIETNQIVSISETWNEEFSPEFEGAADNELSND